jgi:hypothetical protein
MWREEALQCTFLRIVLETTLAKEMHRNAIGALYRPYNIFSDIQENIDHHSQQHWEEKSQSAPFYLPLCHINKSHAMH